MIDKAAIKQMTRAYVLEHVGEILEYARCLSQPETARRKCCFCTTDQHTVCILLKAAKVTPEMIMRKKS